MRSDPKSPPNKKRGDKRAVTPRWSVDDFSINYFVVSGPSGVRSAMLPNAQ